MEHIAFRCSRENLDLSVFVVFCQSIMRFHLLTMGTDTRSRVSTTRAEGYARIRLWQRHRE